MVARRLHHSKELFPQVSEFKLRPRVPTCALGTVAKFSSREPVSRMHLNADSWAPLIQRSGLGPPTGVLGEAQASMGGSPNLEFRGGAPQ